MAEIPLLEPTVLRGVVQTLMTPETLVLSNLLPRSTTPVPYVTWDVLRGSRTVAKPNVPNAEAHIVPRLGRSQSSASLAYFREKKLFSPTTTEWIRRIGTLGDIDSAENAILREVQDLNLRCDNFVEWACWQALTGHFYAAYPDVTIDVDYQFRASHKPTPAVNWSTATIFNIRDDIIAWQRVVQRDARGVGLTDAFVTSKTMSYIFDAAARTGNGTLLTENMRDAFYKNPNMLPGFMGLNWHVVEGQYDTDDGSTALFLADDAVVMGNFSSQGGTPPMEIIYGPSADFDAPQGHTGKFTKAWNEPDPSGHQVLLELQMLPVIYLPDQFIYVANVNAN